jgi:hypothetical protein
MLTIENQFIMKNKRKIYLGPVLIIIKYKKKMDLSKYILNIRIGNEKRQTKVSDVPGPGNYNIPSTIANLPKYQI